MPNSDEVAQILFKISLSLAIGTRDYVLISDAFDVKFQNFFNFSAEYSKLGMSSFQFKLEVRRTGSVGNFLKKQIHYLFTHGYPDLAVQIQGFFHGETNLFD